MSKMVKMFVVIVAVMIQVILGILYGFSGISVPAWGCFLVWCACAVIINRCVGVSEAI